MTATQRAQGANAPMDEGRFLRMLVENIGAVACNDDLETLFINTGSGSVGVTLKKY
jgi:hypothetical protein